MTLALNEHERRFHEALSSLNVTQRKAVETIEGPVMVIAGPGTGKTQILTLRIANILLKTDSQPENILALTFTDSGAKAMRERLRRYTGQVAYRVPIHTFHGFADRLIAQYPEAFPRIIGGTSLTDVEQVEYIEEILQSADISLLRPLGDPTYYVRPLRDIIGHLKQEYITPDQLLTIIAQQEQQLAATERVHTKGAHKGKVRGEYSALEKVIAKNRELHYVYRMYEASLRSAKRYDFNDMIIEVVRALSEDENLLRDLQETYHYILADEHQDVNGSQNKILELLSNFHDTPNIFVVGDEKQAIYRFQGASLENFLYFTDAFPGVTEISLTENYRSGQNILDAAQELITVEDEALMALRVPLHAATTRVAALTRRDFSHQVVEDDWVVTRIQEELVQGVPASEISIIVRTNKEVEAMAALLRKAGIPVHASADGDILAHPITQAVEALLNAVLTDTDEGALFAVLHGAYWGLTIDDIVKITSARNYELSLASILSDTEKLSELGVVNRDRALQIIEVLEEARRREVHEAPHRVLEYLLTASGFIEHVLRYDPFEGSRVIRRLYDEIEAMVLRDGVATLRGVKSILALRHRYELPLQAPFISVSTEAVSVMTAHRSKGLEFATVFIPHLQDSNWGGRATRNLFMVPLNRYESAVDPGDDERRLLYVAFTRAKERLYVSTSAMNIDGKEVVASRLLNDVSGEVMDSECVADFEKRFSPTAAITAKALPSVTQATLVHLLETRGLSATSFNNLLKNPWDFLYRNLLRVPETKTLSLQFGTVVHTVLEKTTAHHTKHGVWPTDADIIAWLEATVKHQPFSVSEYTQIHEKGLAVLMSYLTHLKRSSIIKTKEEFSVRTLFTTNSEELPEITLTGKLDRIDLDDSEEALRVVDYKTGKPKTRAAIEGKTTQHDGSYKRQLVFYALLLSLQDDDRYRTREGVLSFVEPTIHGEIKEESFSITDEELDSLRDELNNAIANFIKGDFLTDRNLAEASEYASLALALMDRK